MKTSELTGYKLDYWVARAQGCFLTEGLSHDDVPCHMAYKDDVIFLGYVGGTHVPQYSPSTNWAQGGPLMEEFELNTSLCYAWEKKKEVKSGYSAWSNDLDLDYGKTVLEAICRAVVRSKFAGDVPEV